MLQSISPDALRLEVYAADALGHMALRGHLARLGAPPTARLAFSGLAFDPTRLPGLVRDLLALAPAKL